MSERPSPRDLVPLPREVHFDDTMREFIQVLRFDVVVGKPLRVQLLLDRRHKKKKSLSKPLGYFRVSQTGQLLDLATGALTMANVLAFQNRADVPTTGEIVAATESVLHLIRQDVATLTEVAFNQVRLHKGSVEAPFIKR